MKSKLQWLAASVAALAFAVPTLAAGDRAPYSAIVVFGTSLSDSGNAFALRGGANTPPDYLVNPLLIPDAPFARGGHHFTNGGTWVEQLARSLGLAGSVRPAYASGSLKATNYAVGAARAYDDGKNINLSDQVQKFLEDYGGAAPSDALYVSEMAETTFATPSWPIKPADSSQPQRSCKRQSAQSLKTFNCSTRLAHETFSCGCRQTRD